MRETPTSSPTNADSLTWRVTFSEAVSNVDAADFVVSGTTATVTAVAAVSGVTAAYDVTASGGNLASVSATVTLTISSSHNIEDGASNDLSNTAPTGTNDNSYVLDNAAPIVTISGLPSASNAPFTATFTFSEAVTGFAMGDITLTNASASNFTATSTTVYTALVTPTASGTVTVDVPANAAQDAVGNGNTAATRASSTYAPPAITIVAGTSPVTEGTSAVFTLSRAGSTTAALTVNVTVSETGGDMVAASNEGDQTVTFLANAATATLSVTTASDSVDEANSVVTATVAADTGSPAGYSVGTPASAMVTVEDNDTRDVTVSTTALTVNEGTTGSYTVVLNSQPTASVMVTPSRTGSSDVTFSPATLTFTTSTWNTVQEVTVTVAQDSDAVNDSATISHAVTGGDYAGVTVESVVVTVDDDETADTTAPRVASIVREAPTSSPTNADSLTWRVTFSETVLNVDAADFAVSGTTATVTAVAAVSGVAGAYDVTASGGDLASVSATVTLAISSSHNIRDGASNALSNTAPTGTNDNSYVVDNTAPSVTISDVPATSDAPFTATFTFSEAVTGFAVGDITLTNASVSNFTATSTTVYTALVTPTASGTVTVDVPANAAQDAVGNGNTAATRASSTYAPPAITIVAGTSPVTEGTSAVFTLSRAGSTTAALTVNVTVSETGGDMVAASNEGDQTVTFLATNDNSYVVDNTAPSVTISGVPATSDAPFTATFTFSEAVTGFAVGDITLTNASVSNFTATSTTVYTALVTPAADGAVTVDVSANAAQDAVGNGNTAATRASSTYTGSATRGVTVSTAALTVNEGTTGTYTVVLDSQPTANVTVTPSRTGSSDVTFSPATLTFTTSTWNTVQEVTVTVAQDSDAVDDSATISHAVTGGGYAGVTVESVVVTVNDDDTAAELDRAALVALYDNAGGDGWHLGTHWKTSQPLNAWFGVTTNSDGRVVGLDLPANNLSGTVLASLSTLTKLDELDLSGNELSGAIPPSLGGLTELKALVLGGNQLNGTIPPSLGGLESVTALYLNDNQLSGAIPPELGDLSSLEELSLRGNRLSGPIPPELGNLLELVFARFADNSLTGCVPHGLRYLVTADEFEAGVPAHDFATDANGDGDTADPGDIAGLALPFCALSQLTLGSLTLEPAFDAGTVAYTASAGHFVTSTTVTATLNNSADGVSITKGADTHMNGDEVPLAVGPNVITIAVTASDGTTAPATYSVTVTRAPNAPPVFDEGRAATRVVEENTVADLHIGVPLTATDADNDTLTYSLDAASEAFFDIDSSGQLWTEADLDHEARNSYSVNVSVSDGKASDGTASTGADSTITVTIMVTDVNEPPVITGPESVTVNEGHTGEVARYAKPDPESGHTNWAREGQTAALSGADADSFEFDKVSGALSFAEPPDFEERASYEVTLHANDGVHVGDHNGELVITVNVTNLEEAGAVTFDRRRPFLNVPLYATLADPDGVQGAGSWSWHRSTSRSGGWGEPIAGADLNFFTPLAEDLDHYLRATVEYSDAHGAKTVRAITEFPAANFRVSNTNPVLPDSVEPRSIPENTPAGSDVGDPLQATDVDDDPLSYSLQGSSDFVIDRGTGQIRVADGVVLDFEAGQSYTLTVDIDDSYEGRDSVPVTTTLTDVNEAPVARDDAATTREDEAVVVVVVRVVDTDSDPENDDLTVIRVTDPPNGVAEVDAGGKTITYTPRQDYHGADGFAYTVSDGDLDDEAQVSVTVRPLNDAPTFRSPPTARSVPENAQPGANVGVPVTATDVDGDLLTYRLVPGADSSSFNIDADSGQITVGDGVTFDIATKDTYTVTVNARDPGGDEARVEVTITVGGGPPIIITGGGGGGGGGGPSPSEVDFEWTVDRDIEELDGGNDRATGVWSDGTTLWVADNADGAGDAVYAYDRDSGERVEEREFALHETNRAPRGFWSDGETVWVSDSGQERLFAYDLGTGERLEEREFALAERNSDARGIWSDEETMWVLDGRADALFAYALASGELLAEYELDSANDDPRGLWSDGVTIWVSDHGAKRLIAYRLPAPEGPAAEDAEPQDLERVSDEEFTELSKASNNSPRGIWSDGDVMYVADESDDRVYTYNMPDAIDARLASLSLSGVEIGEFDPGRTEYEAVVADGVTETTVEAEAMQRRTTIVTDPEDADVEAAGHQVALQDLGEITITVTSADGSRKKTYRVQFPETGWDPARDPWPHCLRGAVSVGFSLVVYEGGSVEELVSCAESRGIVALYALHDGAYVSYILGAPDFVNREFRELFADGLPPITPLIAGSNGPPSADPFGDLDDGGQQPWPECLHGDIAAGFSLVVYEGGSVEELEACAQSRDVTALYTLREDEFVSYILGAPDFVTQPFRDLFADGLPLMTPLVARSEGQPGGR